MNRGQLVEAMAKKARISKKDAGLALAALLDSVTDTLRKGESATLTGFGTFKMSQRAARKGVNPVTKQPMQIPAMSVPKFKAGKILKEALK
ncbi:HU family DNA-binding protein [Patescibacteria group bacterium]|nr:HU family DNA-binding protein [Patescibacteria group bacterium]